MTAKKRKSQTDRNLPAAAVSRQPCEDTLIQEYMDAQFKAESEEFHRTIASHDPSACWWCLNPEPRKALEQAGMTFSERNTNGRV